MSRLAKGSRVVFLVLGNRPDPTNVGTIVEPVRPGDWRVAVLWDHGTGQPSWTDQGALALESEVTS